MEWAVKHWKRLFRGVVHSPAKEVFKRHKDVTQKDVIYCQGSVGQSDCWI